MANVVMGNSFDIAQAHGQHRLARFRARIWILLMHTQHQGTIGRIEVQRQSSCLRKFSLKEVLSHEFSYRVC
jgi:hypothetical protein